MSMVNFMANPELFVTTTVDGYLWGYSDSIMGVCNMFMPHKCKNDKIGVMIRVSVNLLINLHVKLINLFFLPPSS